MPRNSTMRGFSLLELLVVFTIIGILLALATLSVNLVGEDENLEKTARRTHALMALAAEEALLQGRDFGILFEQRGYQFLAFDYDRSEWVAYAGDDMFRSRTLEEGQYFELDVEGQVVLLDAEPPDPENGLVPQVPLLSSGDLVPFELRIRREFDDTVFVVSGQANGVLEVRDESEDY